MGRFRVKANVDLVAARRLVAELEALGAVCSVTDGAGQPVTPPASSPAAPRPAQPKAPAAIAPPPAAPPVVPPRPSVSPAPTLPAAPPRPKPDEQYQSGLSAAFNLPADSRADIGVLASVDSGSFSLATLDGDDEVKPEPATEGREMASPAAADEDLFAPPEMSSAKAFELEVDDNRVVARPPPARAQPDPPAAPAGPAPSLLEQLADMQTEASSGVVPPSPAPKAIAAAAPASVVVPPAEALPVRARNQLSRHPHLRFAVGLVLATLLGLVPAHLFAAIREGSAYDSARADVRDAHHEYSKAITAEELETSTQSLHQVRRDAVSRMESTQTSIAITGLLIWVGCGLGLGFVWFRKIDWARWA